METPDACWPCRPRPDDAEKTILITGSARGGTTFGASIVAHIGVPFDDSRGRVGKRYSNSALMESFGGDEFVIAAREIDAAHPVWAFKHPALVTHESFVQEHIRNPHYIIVFKEPLSVAMRSKSIAGGDLTVDNVLRGTEAVLGQYRKAIRLAGRTTAPVLLMSYDRAIRDLPNAVSGVATFLGLADVDVDSVASRVDGDKDKYFDITRNRRGQAVGN